jgi:hypothetical protein
MAIHDLQKILSLALVYLSRGESCATDFFIYVDLLELAAAAEEAFGI